MNNKTSIRKDQRGLASIVIVILIMTFLTLITIAMTRDSNREQRQSLDRQLNSQAFYAAESGINDAKGYLASNEFIAAVAADPTKIRKQTCEPVDGAGEGELFPDQTSRVGPEENDGIRYSCVMYDTEPASLQAELTPIESKRLVLKTSSGGPLNDLTFTWSQTTGAGNNFDGCPASPQLPQDLSDSNCNAGGLRVELIDYAVQTTREGLIANNFVAYMMPTPPGQGTPSGFLTYGAANTPTTQGQLWHGQCDNETGQCSLTITGVNRADLLLNIRSLYKDSVVTVTSTGNTFKDSQVMVDATGRASGILKRIQVRVDASEFSKRKNTPEAGLQTSSGICKLLDVLPHSVGNRCTP